MFHLFIKKDFESKGGRKSKRKKEGREKKMEEICDKRIEEQWGKGERKKQVKQT